MAQFEMKMHVPGKLCERWEGFGRCLLSTCSCQRVYLQNARHAITDGVSLQPAASSCLGSLLLRSHRPREDV